MANTLEGPVTVVATSACGGTGMALSTTAAMSQVLDTPVVHDMVVLVDPAS